MSEFYKKPTNLYVSGQSKPWKISRSKIELFMGCKRCFYLDRKLGVSRPPGFPFNLNTCVDSLLKSEFDIYRAKAERHPFMPEGLIPFEHEMMDEWRQNFKGVRYVHPETNFLITGAVDDLWVDDKGIVAVVDYKSTSKHAKITALNEAWQDGYKRQMEIYQWLLRKNGIPVASTGYFVYCNGDAEAGKFDKKINFEVNTIPFVGDDSWVDDTLIEIKKCLDDKKIPDYNSNCDYCKYQLLCAQLL